MENTYQTYYNQNRKKQLVFYLKLDTSFLLRLRRGGVLGNFRVGMCCWDPGTLNLYQS